MTPLLHSPACERQRAAHELRYAEYEAAWPNACRKCDASGWLESFDSVPMPFGPGNCSMPTGEPCDCILQAEPLPDLGVCPRCRHVQSVSSDAFADGCLPCEACGWKWGERNGDVRPLFECWGECIMEPQPYRTLQDEIDAGYHQVE